MSGLSFEWFPLRLIFAKEKSHCNPFDYFAIRSIIKDNSLSNNLYRFSHAAHVIPCECSGLFATDELFDIKWADRQYALVVVAPEKNKTQVTRNGLNYSPGAVRRKIYRSRFLLFAIVFLFLVDCLRRACIAMAQRMRWKFEQLKFVFLFIPFNGFYSGLSSASVFVKLSID